MSLTDSFNLEAQLSLISQASEADPLSHPWGYLIWHSGFGCSGPFAFGSFMWFASQAEMLKCLCEHEIFMDRDEEPSPETLQGIEEMRQIAELLRSGALDQEAALAAFNAVFGSIDLEWMGQFENLRQGQGSFAQNALKRFYESKFEEFDPNETPLEPISEADLPDFIEMIQQWCV